MNKSKMIKTVKKKTVFDTASIDTSSQSYKKGSIQASGRIRRRTILGEKFDYGEKIKEKDNYVLYIAGQGQEKKEIEEIEELPQGEKKERIVEQKQIIDNYQYHETKEIKNPKRISIVTHQRLGDIVGGFYEETTYQRMTMNDTGRGPRLYNQQTTKTTTRRGPQGQPLQSTQRSVTASRTVPAQSREYRKEVRQYSNNTNRRNPNAGKSTTTTTTTRTVTTRSRSRPAVGTSTTTTTKTVTRGQSAGATRGKKY